MARGSARLTTSGARRRSHRGAVALLLILGTIAALGGSLAVWLNRQALNTGNWANTSSQLIANRQIRTAVGSYAVQELFSRANVDGTLRGVLPDPLVAPTISELRKLAERLAGQVLATRAARETWIRASRQAQAQFLQTLDHGDPGDAQVTLNLEPLLTDLVQALLGNDLVRALPGAGEQIFGTGSSNAGKLVILKPAQVRRARNVVNGVRGLSLVLPLAGVALFALAIAVARGWRWIVLRRVGWCLALLGSLLLLGRTLAQPALANAVGASSSARPGVQAAWMISTTELRDIALGILVAGIALVLTGWIASLRR